MASKYASVLPGLPRFPGSDPGYAEKVEAEKQKLLADPSFPSDAFGLATEFANLRAQEDEWEEGLKALRLRMDAVTNLLIERYDIDQGKSVTLASGATVSYQPEPYTSVEDRDVFRQWALDNGYERSLALPWQTTNAVAKELLLKGEDIPAGTKVWMRPKLVLRKG